MYFHLTVGVFVCIALAFGESKFVDTLSKCSINDGACQAALVSSSLKAIHKTGIPELGIPPIDPIQFQDVTVSILDLINLDVPEGTAKGLKNCELESVNTEIKKGHTEMKMTCHSFSLKAKYKVSGSSPFLKNILGGATVHGEGNAKVKIEKLQLRFDYFYDMDRNKDGDVYFHCKFNKTIYDYKFLGKVSFAADDIHVGDQDMTKLVVDLLNENENLIMSNFGKIFLDKAMEFVYLYIHKFFNVVPAKYFIVEDLSEYVKT